MYWLPAKNVKMPIPLCFIALLAELPLNDESCLLPSGQLSLVISSGHVFLSKDDFEKKENQFQHGAVMPWLGMTGLRRHSDCV